MDERIEINPRICHGKPIIRGTRVPVSLVLGNLAAGASFEELRKEYDLTDEDVRAALRYAEALVQKEQFHPLPG